MTLPYIHVVGPAGCYGPEGDPRSKALGYHAFFIAYVPFIPSFLSDDFTRMITGEASRIRLVGSRQIRFLNDLSSCKSGAGETFDLRFVSDPQPGQPFNNVWIFFLGKAFERSDHGEAQSRARAHERALALWRKFSSHFPQEDPFNYPLRFVTSRDMEGNTPTEGKKLFDLAWQPIPVHQRSPGNIIEIRKYEDRDPMLSSGQEPRAEGGVGYYPHPFRPTIDFSAMSRFLETFASQPQRCVASICLRPTTLHLEEQREINQVMGHYGRLALTAQEAQNWLALYRRERFEDLRRTFEPIINQRNHLFMVKIQVVGAARPPLEVVSALGSEIMNNSTPEPRRWSEVTPENEEDGSIAFKNLELAEFRPWCRSDETSRLWRLSSLVTSYEALGAFRLPVPPESGHMPGISVRDEPFVIPQEWVKAAEPPDVRVPLGKIIHRGIVTETDFYVSLSQLKRHGLITGSTGSGKTNTCLHLLTRLWQDAGICFLVIYPIDKPDYRLLLADPAVRDYLLLFTLGDDTVSPFRFNPFAVPEGILVRTHISLLMRAFTAAFSMWDPLPAVYRAALRRSYEEAGFRDLRTAKGGDAGSSAPLLSRFYEILVDTAEQMTREYGRDAKGNIRQGSEIRIRDLLSNAGHVLNVSEAAPWDRLLRQPTVMEVGRVGSVEDGALMMGFLLMSLTSHLASRLKREGKPPQHITLIEEAHRLMSAKGSGISEIGDPRGKAGEDFANVLSEVRGYNESLLIAEQIPTELVTGAIANTYLKIAHWMEEQRSFDLFADIMNLNSQQREYARTLPQGQAIVRGAAGRPTLVQVEDYLNRFQHADDSPKIDDSDEALREFMRTQTERLDLAIPEPIPYSIVASQKHTGGESSPPERSPQRQDAKQRDWMMTLPMQTCVWCAEAQRTKVCRFGKEVRGPSVLGAPGFRETCEAIYQELVASEVSGQEPPLGKLPAQFGARYPRRTPDEQVGLLYCYLAHRVQETLTSALGKSDSGSKQERARARQLLKVAANLVASELRTVKEGNSTDGH